MKKHVLVVDDESFIRKLIVKILKQQGYEALEAENGHKAIEMYKDNQDKIALVTLDIRMPEMSGVEVYQNLAKLNPGVRVILCSGFVETLPEGSDAFIVHKPFSIKGLQSKVKEVLKVPDHEVEKRNGPFLYIRI